MSVTRIQAQTANGASVSSLSLALASPVGGCNLLTVTVAISAPAGATTSVSDSTGNTWTSLQKTTDASGNTLETFLAQDAAVGSTTVTVSFSPSVPHAAAIATEWSGVAAAAVGVNIVDAKIGASGSTGNPAAGGASTTQSNELLYAVAASLGSQTLTAGSGWTAGTSAASASSVSIQDEWRDSASGSYSDGWTGGGGVAWLAQIVSFIESSSTAALAPDSASDGGEDSTGGWSNLSPYNDTNGTGYSAGSTSETNTLDFHFNAGDFSVPSGANISGASVSFTASFGAEGSGPTISEVKIGSLDLGGGDVLTFSPTEYTYGGPCQSWAGTNFRGAWDLKLRFTDAAGSPAGSDNIQASHVSATVYYYTPLSASLTSSAGAAEASVSVQAPGAPVSAAAGAAVVSLAPAAPDVVSSAAAGTVEVAATPFSPEPSEPPRNVDLSLTAITPTVLLGGNVLASAGLVAIVAEVAAPALELDGPSPRAGSAELAISLASPGVVFGDQQNIEIAVAVFSPAASGAGTISATAGAAEAAVEVDAPTVALDTLGVAGGVINVSAAVLAPTLALAGAAEVGVSLVAPLASQARGAGAASIAVAVATPSVISGVQFAGIVSIAASVSGPLASYGQSTGGIDVSASVLDPAPLFSATAGAVAVGALLAAPTLAAASVSAVVGAAEIAISVAGPLTSTGYLAGVAEIAVAAIQPPATPSVPLPILATMTVVSPAIVLSAITPPAGAVELAAALASPALFADTTAKLAGSVSIDLAAIPPTLSPQLAAAVGATVEVDSPLAVADSSAVVAGAANIAVSASGATSIWEAVGAAAVSLSVVSPAVNLAAIAPAAGTITITSAVASPAPVEGALTISAPTGAVQVSLADPLPLAASVGPTAEIGVSVVSPQAGAPLRTVELGVVIVSPAAANFWTVAAGDVQVSLLVAGAAQIWEAAGSADLNVSLAAPKIALAALSLAAGAVELTAGAIGPSVSLAGLSAAAATDQVGLQVVAPLAPPDELAAAATIGVSLAAPLVSAPVIAVAGVVTVDANTAAGAITLGGSSTAAADAAVSVSVAAPAVPPDAPPTPVAVGVAIAAATPLLSELANAAGLIDVGVGLPWQAIGLGGVSDAVGDDGLGLSVAAPAVQLGGLSVSPSAVSVGASAADSDSEISGTAAILAGVVRVQATSTLAVPAQGAIAGGAKRVIWIPEARGTVWTLPKRSPRVVT